MTSSIERDDREAYVWIWLPCATEPIVAGYLEASEGRVRFNYGKSYLARTDAIPIYSPELPLKAGILPLLAGMSIPSCIRDAAPDAWGRRVILNQLFGHKGSTADTAALGELTYLLRSGSDRIGALDFQRSPTHYEPRDAQSASLEELLSSVERVEKGIPLTAALDEALFHGTSIGGARPKVLIDEAGKKHIAKFSTAADPYNIVKAEYVAMRLALIVGVDAAPVKLVHVSGKTVLLVERFDRSRTPNGQQRRLIVSALTILGLDEMMARYASYEDLADVIRRRYTSPEATLKELFTRIVYNILCGNTDDHARNHAAFWDGERLTLTPAYDICPQLRVGGEASQAMLIHGSERSSQLKTCLAAAPKFRLSPEQASTLMDEMIAKIEQNWNSVCDEAELSAADRNLLWRRQFLNPISLQR